MRSRVSSFKTKNMLILGIDSSGHTASAALLADDTVLSEYSANIGLTHSQTLLPMVAEIFSHTGHTAAELDAIAVSAGPGSFTGLRIGAATAKGLALGFDIPLVEVSTLEGLMMNVRDVADSYGLHMQGSGASSAEHAVYVHPIMDARRNQVYTAMYQDGRRIGEEEAVSVEELVARINQQPGQHFFLGDAVPVYRTYLEEHLRVPYRFASAVNLLQRASSVALLGAEHLKHGETVRGKDLRLSYIRKPQAEREREAAGLREYDITHEDPSLLRRQKVDRLEARNYKIDDAVGYEDASVPENL